MTPIAAPGSGSFSKSGPGPVISGSPPAIDDRWSLRCGFSSTVTLSVQHRCRHRKRRQANRRRCRIVMYVNVREPPYASIQVEGIAEVTELQPRFTAAAGTWLPLARRVRQYRNGSRASWRSGSS